MFFPSQSVRPQSVRRGASLLATLTLTFLAACRRDRFPSYPADYREFAYVSDGASDTVTVLDLVYLRQDRILQVGKQPMGLAVNPVRNEIYAVNNGSDSVSVIDAAANRVVFTMGVHHAPRFISVAPDGKRAYVANSGSNTLSVLDLETHRELAVAATGEQPNLARVSPDNRSVVVSNSAAGSISIYAVSPSAEAPVSLRASFDGCPGATDITILPDSSKAFIACSGASRVLVIWLAASADSWRGRQDARLQRDQKLTLLDVGKTPVHLALKPDGGEVFSSNVDADSISEISTWTNEVIGTYMIGSQPTRGVVSRDNSSFWVTNSGADSASLYSIDEGRMAAGVRTGAQPGALAFSADEHLLLVADKGSADIAVIRAQTRTLFTLLPGGRQPNDIVVKAFSVNVH